MALWFLSPTLSRKAYTTSSGLGSYHHHSPTRSRNRSEQAHSTYNSSNRQQATFCCNLDMSSIRDQTNDKSGSSGTGTDNVQALTASVGKLSMSDLWASLDPDLNTKSGKLHGKWSFDGIMSDERPHGRFLSYYRGIGISGPQNDAGWIGEAHGTGHTNLVEIKRPEKKNGKKHQRSRRRE